MNLALENPPMKAFWNDCGAGPDGEAAIEVHEIEAIDLFSDQSGVKGNYFGLIDAQDRTAQFYFVDGIPDHVEDARHLKIVLFDLPVQARKGSFSKTVTIGEVHGLIRTIFAQGADPAAFPGLAFEPW